MDPNVLREYAKRPLEMSNKSKLYNNISTYLLLVFQKSVMGNTWNNFLIKWSSSSSDCNRKDSIMASDIRKSSIREQNCWNCWRR